MCLIQSKFKASLVHLLLSGVVVSLVGLCVFFVWYPGLLAWASMVTSVFLLMAFVDVCMGPLMTFVVFNTKKKELKRDLAIVVFLQVLALVVAVYSIFIARPAFIVFNAGQFDLVYANDLFPLDSGDSERNALTSVSLFGPKLVAAVMPSDQEEAAGLVMAHLVEGHAFEARREYYVSYHEVKQDVVANMRPMNEFVEARRGDGVSALRESLSRYSIDLSQLGMYKFYAGGNEMIAVIGPEGDYLGVEKLEGTY